MATNSWEKLYADEKLYDKHIHLSAEVVYGFKRGSKELGIPTANLSMDDLGADGDNLETGIYFGWAVLKAEIFKTVVSVGWNPFYNNVKRTVEAHLLCNLPDFYGEHIQIFLVGFLRQECSFDSVEDLISCIHSDIERSKGKLTDKTKPLGYNDIDDKKTISKL